MRTAFPQSPLYAQVFANNRERDSQQQAAFQAQMLSIMMEVKHGVSILTTRVDNLEARVPSDLRAHPW